MKLSISLCLAGMVMASSANAATIVAFTSVDAVSVAADTEGIGVTGFNLARSDGLTQVTGGSTFNSKNFQEGTDKLSALAANNSIFWGFNSTQGYDLTSLSFGYDRSGLGPVSIAVDFFIGGVFQAEIFSDAAVPDNSSGLAAIDLSAYDDVVNGFFRLTGWVPGGGDGRGTFDIENRAAGDKGIILTGELSAVPLPAAAWLFGSGLLGLVVLKRKRS